MTEVGSALNGHRRKFLTLLRDPSVGRGMAEILTSMCARLYGKRAAANRAKRALAAAATDDGRAA